ncbi:hypothetical protein ACXYTP_00085 [Tsukamurella ocularis]|uniref:hypothetical protein n=1 Tax=Tsukamurella ocularis TaxID=1970234 RepID=UPI0039F118E9
MLAFTVFLVDDEGQMHEFPAGTVPPDWAVDRITNPYAWADDPVDDVQDAQRAVVEAQANAAAAEADVAAAQADLDKAADTASATLTELKDALPATEAPKSAPGTTPPPQDGPAASRLVWEEYATANGITVQANWKRGDIIEACIAAGVAV